MAHKENPIKEVFNNYVQGKMEAPLKPAHSKRKVKHVTPNQQAS